MRHDGKHRKTYHRPRIHRTKWKQWRAECSCGWSVWKGTWRECLILALGHSDYLK